jgi:hypothetical protein
VRTRSVWAFSTALVAGITLALPMMPMTALAAAKSAQPSPPQKAVTARSVGAVTLPTGEQVRLARTASGRQSVLTQPAAASGPGRALVTQRLGSHLYVTPADARPYLGRFLDPGLFDVTRLLAAANAKGRLPVRISYTGSTPSVPGVTITSASAGAASGYLTTASSATFGRALTALWKADAKAGWPQRSTLFPRVKRIAADGPGAVGVTPKFPMFTLIIKTIGADGKPQPEGFLGLLNVDDGAKYGAFVSVVDGEARVSVPKGNYSAIADDFALDPSGTSSTIRVVTVNQYTVTGAGQTLMIDLRKATARPSVTAPKRSTMTDYGFEWERTDATQASSLGSGYEIDGSSTFLVSPSKAAKIGTINTIQNWSLAGPGSKPSYTYNLATEGRLIPAHPHYTFTAKNLATITSSYYSDGPDRTGGFLRFQIFPDQFGGGGTYARLPLGTKRTEYVGATGKPIWIDSFLANYDSFDDPGFVDAPERLIPAGTAFTTAWMRGPLGAGIPIQSSEGFCYGCRSGNTIDLGLAPLLDSTPGHTGELFGAEDGLPVARFRFYKNGKLVSDQDDWLGGTFTVQKAAATYKAVLDVDRRLVDPIQSTRSSTELTFSSANGKGAKLPSTWFCNADTASCHVLALLQARLALPTTLNGLLPEGKSNVTVTAAQVQNATRSAITSATLEVRPAGWFWTTVKLKSIGGGRYQGVVDNSGFAGSNVDVRISATDKAGSTYKQTVLRAYTVAGS